MIYWFTGQPGAGKTTLSKHLISYLENTEKVIHIDGDDLRLIFENKDFSETGRRKNIERAQDIARFMNEKGYSVVVSLVSPYKDMRDTFKTHNSVIEIYVHTTETRGRESFHVSSYEPPTENFIDINTTNKDERESFIELIKFIDL
jgi:adenylylsulfate kinase-like enzyme